jgi:hypothetical protein
VPKLGDVITLDNRSGEAVTAAGYTITPQSQALTIRFPYGGFVWNRPVAVSVEQAGRTNRIPIVDVTRIAQLGAYAVVMLWALLYLIVSRLAGRSENG